MAGNTLPQRKIAACAENHRSKGGTGVRSGAIGMAGAGSIMGGRPLTGERLLARSVAWGPGSRKHGHAGNQHRKALNHGRLSLLSGHVHPVSGLPLACLAAARRLARCAAIRPGGRDPTLHSRERQDFALDQHANGHKARSPVPPAPDLRHFLIRMRAKRR